MATLPAILAMPMLAASGPEHAAPAGNAAGASALALTSYHGGAAAPDTGATHSPQTLAQESRAIQPTYSIQVGLDGEIFPVFANHASLQPQDERTWGTVAVSIHNSSAGTIDNRVTVAVPGWSDQEIQMVEIPAGESHTLLFAPTFLQRLYQNKEIAAATVDVTVENMAGQTVFAQTVPVRLRAADDMFWGASFKYAPFVASWVTPHDPEVEMILARAKELAPERRLPGYEDWKNQAGQQRETTVEARAIYEAVQSERLSYVKSSLTFGRNLDVTERIRLPHESLAESSANCIDGVVLYASLFENLGMDPEVVLVPGHAYIGVRVARGAQQYLYFDSALTGRADFAAAVRAAAQGMAKVADSKVITVRVDDARRAGIFPMPEGPADIPLPGAETASHAAAAPLAGQQ